MSSRKIDRMIFRRLPNTGMSFIVPFLATYPSLTSLPRDAMKLFDRWMRKRDYFSKRRTGKTRFIARDHRNRLLYSKDRTLPARDEQHLTMELNRSTIRDRLTARFCRLYCSYETYSLVTSQSVTSCRLSFIRRKSRTKNEPRQQHST
jgi:hypothetical protein